MRKSSQAQAFLYECTHYYHHYRRGRLRCWCCRKTLMYVMKRGATTHSAIKLMTLRWMTDVTDAQATGCSSGKCTGGRRGEGELEQTQWTGRLRWALMRRGRYKCDPSYMGSGRPSGRQCSPVQSSRLSLQGTRPRVRH